MEQQENKNDGEAKKKILLLEDYPDFIEFYHKRLQEAGFNVLVESDEDHGLGAVKKEKPDLIILDISLPKTEDFGFIKELKKMPELAAIPVVILTDLASEEDKKEGLLAGAAEYIIRDDLPFAQVIEKIKEIVRSKKNP